MGVNVGGHWCFRVSFAYGYFLGGFTVFSTGYVLLMLGIRIASGALLAGVGGKVVVDGLLATGSLRGYAITERIRVRPVPEVIRFDEVSFRYPDDEEWIFEDLSFSVEVEKESSLRAERKR